MIVKKKKKILKTLVFSYRFEVLEIFSFTFHFPALFLCTDHYSNNVTNHVTIKRIR